jgi:hypothetical protein
MKDIYFCNLTVSYFETEKARTRTRLTLKEVVYKPTGIDTLNDKRILRKFKCFGDVKIEGMEIIAHLGKSLI